MANGYNPNNSAESMLDFLLNPGANGENVFDPGAGIDTSPIPVFTDSYGADGRQSNEFLVDTQGQVIDPTLAPEAQKLILDAEKLEISQGLQFMPADYDFDNIDNYADADMKATTIRGQVTKMGIAAEKKKAEELGLPGLRDQYLALAGVPGIGQFESSRQRLAIMEDQIRAKEAQLRTWISKGADGKISGELAEAFADADTLAEQWGKRAEALRIKEQREHQSRNDLTDAMRKDRLAQEANTLAELGMGGEAGTQTVADILGITYQEALSRFTQGQVSKEVLKLAIWEQDKGRQMTIADAYSYYSKETVGHLVNRAARQIEGMSTKQVEEIVNSADLLVNKHLDSLAGSLLAQRKKGAAEGDKISQTVTADERTALLPQAKQRAIDEAFANTENLIKQRDITPESYRLQGVGGVSPQVQNVADYIIATYPEELRYTPDPKQARVNVLKMANEYEQMRADRSMAVSLPSFFDVYPMMMQKMTNTMNADYEGLAQFTGRSIVDSSDETIQAMNLTLLHSTLKKKLSGEEAAHVGIPGGNVGFASGMLQSFDPATELIKRVLENNQTRQEQEAALSTTASPEEQETQRMFAESTARVNAARIAVEAEMEAERRAGR